MKRRERREAGVLVPLFSLRGAGDWGVGEIGHVGRFCHWLARAGHHLLQLLPINEMSPGERSPYAALSAFAIDPIYVSLAAIEDFVAAGGEEALPRPVREALAAARRPGHIDYQQVRKAKRGALEMAFARFLDTEWAAGSARARELRRFEAEEADGWLPDYTLFRACHEQRAGRAWTTWERPLRDREPAALDRARAAAARERLFLAYVQWIAAVQWADARREAGAAGVRLKGDLPFMVGMDSADVWGRQQEFSLEASLGAPPDAFNADGQQWGLPVCRWDVMAHNGFAWLRARAANAAALFDAVRLDHVVGLYRMYVIPAKGEGTFVPATEAEQRAGGERLLRVLLEAAGDTELIAEDLGVVPAFVHASLERRRIPGYRVLRWEQDAGVFRDPSHYPRRSVATSGTHDTSSLATWWSDELDEAGRRALAAVPAFRALSAAGTSFTADVHETLLDGLYGAASELVVVPFPDAYGGRERINVPATVAPSNWSYRLPWTLDELDRGEGRALRERLRALVARHRG